MPEETREEDLLRSIDAVDARIRAFRDRVRALLAQIESSRDRTAGDQPQTAAA